MESMLRAVAIALSPRWRAALTSCSPNPELQPVMSQVSCWGDMLDGAGLLVFEFSVVERAKSLLKYLCRLLPAALRLDHWWVRVFVHSSVCMERTAQMHSLLLPERVECQL